MPPTTPEDPDASGRDTPGAAPGGELVLLAAGGRGIPLAQQGSLDPGALPP